MISPVTIAFFFIALITIVWLSVKLIKIRESVIDKDKQIEEYNSELRSRIPKSENPGNTDSGIKEVSDSLSGLLLNTSTDRIAFYDNDDNLKFANPEPGVMELFQTLHLHTIFQIYDDMDNCLRSF